MKYAVILLFMVAACALQDESRLSLGQVDTTKKDAAKVKIGKPGAAVELLDKQSFAIQPGERVSLPIKLSASYSAGNMLVNISPNDALNIGADQLAFSFDLSKGELFLLPLVVQAETPGRYYINLHVELLSGGQKNSRILAVIVVVASNDSDKVQDVIADDTLGRGHQKVGVSSSLGVDAVINLPAQEKIVTE